jgi:hypothetical protein
MVISADFRLARAKRIENVRLIEVERRHFQQRGLRIRERRVGVIEEVVGGHGLLLPFFGFLH